MMKPDEMQENTAQLQFLTREGGTDIAYRKLEASGDGEVLPTVVFLGGFRSDMEGTKATYLEKQCRKRGQAYVRFDYSGHGSSGGAFKDCTIGGWKDDALFVIDNVTQGGLVLVGSSMGGWIAMLAALARPDRIKALVGIAAAPDFTREMRDEHFSKKQLAALEEQGFTTLDNDYSDEPYIITQNLIEEAENHCLLDDEIALSVPFHLVQGMKDSSVPWQKAHRIKNAVGGDKAEVFLIEEGDHSLSNPEELVFIDQQICLLSL